MPKKIIVLSILLLSVVFLPLAILFGLNFLATNIMSSAPSSAGLKTISWISQAGGSLIKVYSPLLPKETEFFFETAENKYSSRLLIYGLKNQTEVAINQVISGGSGAPEAFSAMEQKANDLLKQLAPADNSRKLIAFGRELLPLAKWAMGFDHKKTFLLVLQNSMEQRPTGGLIEGLGVVVLEKGQLLDLTWSRPDDVEAALTGTEDSPQPIKTMLAESRLLFRDANWSIDGPSAAVQLKKMYERATGRGADGVVFFSTQGFEDIISEVGKVAIGPNPEMTAESLKEKSAFAGPEFTLQIGKAVFQTLKPSPFPAIQGLIKALQNENVLVIPFEADPAKLAAQLGIDGGVKKLLCPAQLYSSKCSQNFIYIVDANLGAKRSDYFLKKGRRVLVTLAPDSQPATTLELAYANTSRVDGSSTAYRGYTRVAIPLESVVQSIVEVENGRGIQIAADNYIEFGQHIIGFPLEIMPGAAKLIKINYVSTNKIPIERGIGAYILNFKKQAGDSVETQVEINLPDRTTPLSVYPRAGVTDNNLIFRLPMKKSDSAAVEFAINDLFR